MAFAQQIQQRAESLTPSERRLVSSVLDQPRTAALSTVTELAKGAGVHEATVSRLARKLGYSGFAAFRQALQEEFIPSQETATRLKKTIDTAGEEGVLGTLVAHEVEGLSKLGQHVDDDAVTAVARALMSARKIFIFGHGNAEILALMMAKRFRRFGRDVHLLAGDARELAEQALGMGAQDVLLAYAFRRPHRQYAPLMGLAAEAGTRTIVISGSSGHVLVPAPDQLLSAPRGGDAQGFQTLTVPMAISNAIVIAAGALDEKASLKTLDRLGSLIERFD
ncbi:MurR/RpiR family transcriptional regulator [Cucumibacter marinus]|uniref:MurR/RpiR family transcriptional regulator n=1 Tax=Cucumibacter marinus TaxID=1121252 RepID=UPI00040A6C9A|nr:MurR/RpiR family transcriptional regulator [Cucumibacter marinus]